MKLISIKTLRDAEWLLAYTYEGRPGGYAFSIYTAENIPGLTIAHERRGKKVNKIYTVTATGRRTESSTQAVRYYNEQARTQATGDRRPAPGSVESIARTSNRGDNL